MSTICLPIGPFTTLPKIITSHKTFKIFRNVLAIHGIGVDRGRPPPTNIDQNGIGVYSVYNIGTHADIIRHFCEVAFSKVETNLKSRGKTLHVHVHMHSCVWQVSAVANEPVLRNRAVDRA